MRYEQWVIKNLNVSSRFGDEVLVLCPFHKNSSTAACCVNIRKGLYVCYSCGAKGHITDMAKALRAPLTAHFDAEAVGEGLQRLRAAEANTEAVRKLPEKWLDQFGWQRPHKYWTEERKFKEETCVDWKLGYDKHSNSGIIPIRDVKGNLLGVVRRKLGKLNAGEPRYLYPKGFKISWHLFGAWRIEDGDGPLCVCEGSLDAIAMTEAGYTAVALLGARLHPHQLTILTGGKFDDVVLCLDNDEAGQHASKVAAAQLVAEGFNVQVSRKIDGKKDPASMTIMQRRIAVSGAESYMRLRIRDASA